MVAELPKEEPAMPGGDMGGLGGMGGMIQFTTRISLHSPDGENRSNGVSEAMGSE